MATKKKVKKTIKKQERVVEPLENVIYYRERLNATLARLKVVRNELSALEALQATYLIRLDELQDHH